MRQNQQNMETWKLPVLAITLILQVETIYSDDGAMFPYGTEAGDQSFPPNQQRNPNGALSLNLPQKGVIVFNRIHHSLVISNHGTLYFAEGMPVFSNTIWPNQDVDSPPFIAPFYFEPVWDTISPTGTVYHRMLNMDSQNPSLATLGKFIQDGVVGASSFNAKYGVIATWWNLTGNATSSKRNTFQAVLLSNDVDTYVILNYAYVLTDGKGGQAGIYAGDHVRWTPVLLGRVQSLANIGIARGSSDVVGRFLFKVSGDHVVRGGCSQEQTGTLSTFPEHSGMYGGEIIEVTGPCFSQSSKPKCLFGDVEGNFQYVNEQKSRCTVPKLLHRGEITLSVIMGTQEQPLYNYSTQFTILLPGRMSAGVIPDRDWNETDAESLTLHWKDTKLSLDETATVDIYLIGYREDSTQAYWDEILKLGENITNSLGKPSDTILNTGFTFKPVNFRCSGYQCTQYEIGLVEVRLKTGLSNTHRSLYSYNQPLGWFVTDDMAEKHGENWPTVLCHMWDEKDKQETEWIEELLHCPCSLDQALADFGRWQADTGCNIFRGSKCTYHRGAVHCVRSVQPTASGAGNQCCYMADGNLKYAADSFQGSTPDKGHAWGAVPYGKPGYVPEESHWLDDVITFYYCCLWTEYSNCDTYMDRRATRDCLGYRSSGAAMAFGDPHISTLDGLTYRFDGKGEFTLLRYDTFWLQGRFDQITSSPDGELNNVTVLTGVALQDGDSDTVEIKLRPQDGALNTKLDIVVNGVYKTFGSDETHWQDFNGVAVVTEIGNYMQNNVTVLLHSGVGVQVAETNGLLHVIVSAPPEWKDGETRGLFGVWDDDTTNDLRPFGHMTHIDSSDPEALHVTFGLSWNVSKEDSLFRAPQSVDDKNLFLPLYVDVAGSPPGIPPSDLETVCGDNTQCRFDYIITGDRLIAEATQKATEWYNTMEAFLRPVQTCGLLDVPRSIKDNTDYRDGSTVTLKGCRLGHFLLGPTVYTCEGGTWSPTLTTRCFDDGAFPYGTEAGDQSFHLDLQRNPNGAVSLNLPPKGVIFFNRIHHSLVISNHGTLYFAEGMPVYSNTIWPNQDVDSPPFIAPFYFEPVWDTISPTGTVYHRLLNMDSQNPRLATLDKFIQDGVVGASSFNAKYGVIATWWNLTGNATSSKRNTFQAVLLSNDVDTYVILNYVNLSTDVKDEQAGIYAGDHVRWTPVLPSNGQLLADIETVKGSSDVVGRFLFKVSGDHVVRGGCSQQQTGTLSTFPDHAGMYGGEIIDVSGPCFSQGSKPKCMFGDVEGDFQYVNEQKARCTVPKLLYRGEITLRVIMGTQEQPLYNYSTQFTILLPGRISVGVDPYRNWNETNAESLTLYWNDTKLSLDGTATVDIYLIGYREDSTQAYWDKILTLGEDVTNSLGMPSDTSLNSGFTFNPVNFRCSGDQCTQYEIGLIEVRLRTGLSNTHRSLYSYNLPLGWFVTDAMAKKHGENWPTVLCHMWDEKDQHETEWIEELLHCPCSLDQALADFGRWQADTGCNIFTGSKCTYHRGAVHCVRTVQPTINPFHFRPSGAGNQCCYMADGNLKYAADSFQGSTPDKGHAWGAVPYGKPGYVPEESHWLDDVITFYYCCLWTEYGNCDTYMDRRPTRDCLGYRPSGIAMAFGDPHISTFDGLTYRFDGKGEFTLLRYLTFWLQGRFEQITTSPNGELNNVTVLTGVAMKDGDSDTVEIKLRPQDGALNTRLDIIMNGVYKTFGSDETHWQDFNGVAVVTEIGNYKQNNVTVLLHSGIGIQVAETNGLLHVIVSAPPEWKDGETMGLFGVWDDDMTNDLRPFGQVAHIDPSDSDAIYFNFGLTWNVSKEDSLFGAPQPVDENRLFQPLFIDATGSPPGIPPPDLETVCGDNTQCRFDYIITGDRSIAEATLNATEWYNTMKEFLQPVQTCGLLDVPRSIKDNTDYRDGSTVTLKGCRLGHFLRGPTVYTCEGSTWSPALATQCIYTPIVQASSLRRNIGIGVGVTLGVILIIVIIVFVKYRRGRSDKKSLPV